MWSRRVAERRRWAATCYRALLVENLESRRTMYGGHGLEFNVTPTAAVPAEMLAAFQTAAQIWSSKLTDDILVNVNIDFTAAAAGLGQAIPASQIIPLSALREAMIADVTSMSDQSATLHLPAGAAAAIYTTDYGTGAPLLDDNSTENNTKFQVTRANAKALGLLSANDPASDGTIRFLNVSYYDFDRSNGISSGLFDFVAIAVHEIGHFLGFVAGADLVDFRSLPNGPGYNPDGNQDNQIIARPLDLFRHSAASVAAGADFDMRADTDTKYFSINGGATAIAPFSTGTHNGDGEEIQHWLDNQAIGLMDPSITNGEFGELTSLDLQAIDVIGWNLAPVPEVAVTGRGLRIASGDPTPTSADDTDFGSVSQGNAIVTHTFTVANYGTADLTLGPVMLPPGFALGANPLVALLSPGASDTFSVQLTGAAVGDYAGDLSFVTNDWDEGVFHFQVRGKVTPHVNTPPTITSLVDTPDPVVLGQNITLTAGGVADSDGTVTLVEFYRDVDNDNIVDPTDVLLGVDVDGSNGWQWTGSTANFPAGTQRYMVRARDNDLAWSANRYTTGFVNIAPTLGELTVSSNPVHRGDNLTITALGAADTAPGSVIAVEFYRDANVNGAIDANDVLLGTDATSADGWFKTVSTSTFPLGDVRVLARAKDNNNAYSPISSVNFWVNNKPTVGTLTDSPDPVLQGQNVTLVAGSVADTDGTVGLVEFYRDLDNNSAIDPTDSFLGADANGADGWSWTGSTASFPVGSVRYLTRARDNNLAWSATRSSVGLVNVPPTIANLSFSANPIVRGDYLTVTALGVADAAPGFVAVVEFYRDANNDQLIGANDVLLGSDTTVADGWFKTVPTSNFPLGGVTILARARDNNNVYSATASLLLTVNAPSASALVRAASVASSSPTREAGSSAGTAGNSSNARSVATSASDAVLQLVFAELGQEGRADDAWKRTIRAMGRTPAITR